MSDRPLGIVFTSSEMVGFAKTGGLADVCGALPVALSRRGHRVAVILPLYRSIRVGAIPIEPTPHLLAVPFGVRIVPSRLWKAHVPRSNVAVYLIEHGAFFERDEAKYGRSYYQYTSWDGRKYDYGDNADRFIFYCRAAMEAMMHLDFRPDVIHANDWQAGLIPVYLREKYPLKEPLRQTSTLFTIHNIAYQGLFPQEIFPLTGLDKKLLNPRELEFYGKVSFLKAGCIMSDWTNTVSPTYAKEIRTEEYGCGMDGILREREGRLSGIVNGVDYTEWNPATDKHLVKMYDVTCVEAGKAANKRDIQHTFLLPEEPQIPLIGLVARLVEQKGIDLVIDYLEQFGEMTQAQFVILGEGDPEIHQKLIQLKERYPNKLAVKIGFDESMAHRIEAACDFFLMPSRYEPSGLNQLYSLKYGSPPIVRKTGGLADTITDTNSVSLANRTANGISFEKAETVHLKNAIERAIQLYRNTETYRLVQATGMGQDWSWNRSAAEYETLYRHLIAEKARPGMRIG